MTSGARVAADHRGWLPSTAYERWAALPRTEPVRPAKPARTRPAGRARPRSGGRHHRLRRLRQDRDLSVDGQQRTVRTFAGTVGDVLDTQGIQRRPRARPGRPRSPTQRLDDGEPIVVRFGRPVLLTVDGETRTVWTTARSVDEALRCSASAPTAPTCRPRRSRRSPRRHDARRPAAAPRHLPRRRRASRASPRPPRRSARRSPRPASTLRTAGPRQQPT